MKKAPLPTAYFKQVRKELAKVVWTNREETIKLTAVVIMISVGIGLFIGALDILFVKITEILL